MKIRMVQLFIIMIMIIGFTGFASASDSISDINSGRNDDMIEAMSFLKDEADRICDESDSDYIKIQKLNQYVCDKVNYDYSNRNSGLVAFVEKDKVLCSGYAEALAYLLDCANVKNFTLTDYVSSGRASVLHIWNVVYVDDDWLHVDPTWNDMTRSTGKPDGGYFLLSGKQISKNRQTMSLKTTKDYNDYYEFIKTVTLSLETYNINNDQIKNGDLLVPLSETVNTLGGHVKQSEDGEITVILDSKKLNLTIGSKTGLIDNEEFCLDTAPQTNNGTVLVPARMVLEKLGVIVDYDSESSVMTIAYDPYQTK